MTRAPRLLKTLLLSGLTAFATLAAAQSYPDKAVRMVVGMAPGGSNDTIARMISAELTKAMGQPVVVENRPGANSVIATTEIAKARPDGHSLMLVISSHVTNTLLYPNLNYKLSDFAPVSVIADTPFLLIANPKFAPNTVQEVIKLAKDSNGAVDFGSPGLGSTQHISLELMNQLAGVRMNHIPYKGGAPAQADLLAGVIPLIFATPTQSLPMLQDGRLKAIAVTSTKRLPQLPNVPTIAESGLPGYDATVWFGVVAPAGTPKPVIETLNRHITAIVKRPDIQAQLEKMGLNPVASTPEAFQQLLDSELKKWSEVIKTSGLKLE